MKHALAALCVLSLAAAAYAAATYDSPEAAAKAPQDGGYYFQGEYTGERQLRDGAKQAFGLQVIGLGKGKCRAVLYPGGLPGAGGSIEGRVEAEGTIIDHGVTFEFDNARIRIAFAKDSFDIVTAVIGRTNRQKIGTLDKVERKSDTLGKAAPAGATVLFDGTKESLGNWKPGAKITDDGLLMQGVTSNATFGDCTVHVEFRLPFMPEARGQGRGNSGCYVQGRYEVQMLDSFGLTGEDNECGGVYKIAKPAVNMCYPPLTWQTYDIEFTAAKFDDAGKKAANARFTVHHNGVKIHDNVELTHATAAAPVKEGPDGGPIYLQDHGNPVRYRNIWVMPKAQ